MKSKLSYMTQAMIIVLGIVSFFVTCLLLPKKIGVTILALVIIGGLLFCVICLVAWALEQQDRLDKEESNGKF